MCVLLGSAKSGEVRGPHLVEISFNYGSELWEAEHCHVKENFWRMVHF